MISSTHFPSVIGDGYSSFNSLSPPYVNIAPSVVTTYGTPAQLYRRYHTSSVTAPQFGYPVTVTQNSSLQNTHPNGYSTNVHMSQSPTNVGMSRSGASAQFAQSAAYPNSFVPQSSMGPPQANSSEVNYSGLPLPNASQSKDVSSHGSTPAFASSNYAQSKAYNSGLPMYSEGARSNKYANNSYPPKDSHIPTLLSEFDRFQTRDSMPWRSDIFTSKPQAESSFHPEFKSEPESMSKYKSEYKSQFEPEHKSKYGSEFKSKSKYRSAFKSQQEPEFKSKYRSAIKSQHEPEFKSKYVSEFRSKHEPHFQSKYGSEFQSKYEPEFQSKYEPQFPSEMSRSVAIGDDGPMKRDIAVGDSAPMKRDVAVGESDPIYQKPHRSRTGFRSHKKIYRDAAVGRSASPMSRTKHKSVPRSRYRKTTEDKAVGTSPLVKPRSVSRLPERGVRLYEVDEIGDTTPRSRMCTVTCGMHSPRGTRTPVEWVRGDDIDCRHNPAQNLESTSLQPLRLGNKVFRRKGELDNMSVWALFPDVR